MDQGQVPFCDILCVPLNGNGEMGLCHFRCYGWFNNHKVSKRLTLEAFCDLQHLDQVDLVVSNSGGKVAKSSRFPVGTLLTKPLLIIGA
jgi:hypothetical protein